MKVKNKENGQKRKYQINISMKSKAVVLSVGKFLFHSSMISINVDPRALEPTDEWMDGVELRLRCPVGL